MKTLTVICPVYNEEGVISSFYAELHRVLTTIASRYSSKVLFVVDRSTDRTMDVLRDIARQDHSVQVLALSSRFGHQMSLLAGIDHCSSDAVIMMDSDLQHPPALIPELLDTFEKGYDIVFTIRNDGPGTGFFKRVTSRGFYKVVNRISQVPINQGTSDFRVISRRVAELFQTRIRERNQFLRGLFSWIGFKSVGVPFQARERAGGMSKYTVGRMMQFGVHGIISFSKRPLHAAIILGFLVAGFGFLLAIFTFIDYFLKSSLPSGWTTLVILISMFSGVQLISLGIIGEYIGAIFDEVKQRPQYIIEERINIEDEKLHRV